MTDPSGERKGFRGGPRRRDTPAAPAESAEVPRRDARPDASRRFDSEQNRGTDRRRSDPAQRRTDGPRRPERGGSADRRPRSGDHRPDVERRPRREEETGSRRPRADEPDLPEDVVAGDLDPAVRRDLLSLDKANADTVARHLIMAADLVVDDPPLALAHARAARQRAGRIAVVRETAGITAYHAGEWAEALSELRAARRMSGGPGLLAVMADCERGLGRPERAIELGRSDEARELTGDEAIELRIVVAGARMDLGEYDQAVVTLQTSDLDPKRTGPTAARLFYAYADALVAAGRTDDGLTWFLNAAAADLDGDTDAEERVAELTGYDDSDEQ